MGHPKLPHEIAIQIARRKARKLKELGLFKTHDHDDLEQDLLLRAAEAWVQFDPGRFQPDAFIGRAVENGAIDMIRAIKAAKRGAGVRILSIDHPKAVETVAGGESPVTAAIAIETVVATDSVLNEDEHHLARLAAEHGLSGAARALGLARTTVNSRWSVLKKKVLAAAEKPAAASSPAPAIPLKRRGRAPGGMP